MLDQQETESVTLPTLDKFHELEVQKIFEAMLSIQNLRVQLGSLFITVNLTMLGVAFSLQKQAYC
jgi:hypothetical protein